MRYFLSYATADYEWTTRLSASMQGAGQTTWFAPADMRIGRFSQQLAQNIKDCDVFAVVVSARSVASAWVEKEFIFAQSLNKTIIPIIISDFRIDSELALLIGNLNHVDGRSKTVEAVAQELIENSGHVTKNGRVLAIFNMKGGVGKTVLAANIASAVALRSSRSNVLLVDMDPQFNLSQVFFNDEKIAECQSTGLSLLALFDGAVDVRTAGLELVQSLAGPAALGGFQRRADILLGHDSLFDFSIDRRTQRDREVARNSLRRFISAARRSYDVVVLDMNPSASFPTLCALDVADHFVAPVRPERFAVRGLSLLQRIVEKVRERSAEPEEFSILFNQASQRNDKNAHALLERTRQSIEEDAFFKDTLLEGWVPYSAALQSPLAEEPFTEPLREATAFGRPTGATNLRKIITELAQQAVRRAGVEATWDLN